MGPKPRSFVLCLSDSWRCQPPKASRAGPALYPSVASLSVWLETTATKVQAHRGVKPSRLGILLSVDFRFAGWFKNNENYECLFFNGCTEENWK